MYGFTSLCLVAPWPGGRDNMQVQVTKPLFVNPLCSAGMLTDRV